jgi:hypothetical protein
VPRVNGWQSLTMWAIDKLLLLLLLLLLADQI